jgi:uncharacterized protein
MLTALLTGLLGSFHCVGMCGSLVLAIQAQRWQSIVLYHTGRSMLYAVFGLLFGLFGRGLYIAGFQQYISVILGIAMIIFVVIPNGHFPFLYGYYQKARQFFKPFQQRNQWAAAFVLGVLNGLLPCGLVYIAVFAAIATADALYGALYMFLFGVGTMPLLLALHFTQHQLPTAWRIRMTKTVPYFVVLVGCLLIMRGLDLGIPYLSPHFAPYIIACCH